MDQIFFKAIRETFPNLDKPTQKEIYAKVLIHILEFLKKALYKDAPDELNALEQMLLEEPNETTRFEIYSAQIFAKFAKLPQDEQIRIGKMVEEELTAVMHKLYKAYE